MKIEIERTYEFDIASMISRSPDKDNPKAIEAAKDFVRRSVVIFVGKADGLEVCAVGLIPVSVWSKEAYFWLIHTDLCEAHPFLFVRWSRRVLDMVLAIYPRVFGHCVNEKSARWLCWLGAEFNGISFRLVR